MTFNKITNLTNSVLVHFFQWMLVITSSQYWMMIGIGESNMARQGLTEKLTSQMEELVDIWDKNLAV